MVYKSKIGLELIIPITILLGWIMYNLIIEQSWLGIFIVLLLLSFFIYLFKTTYYVIEKDILHVKSGFLINSTIEINSITKISETYNPLSSPALSIDRLEIVYNTFDSILISPKNKKSFIESILKINPTVIINLRNSKNEK
jgi:hypothetical protein